MTSKIKMDLVNLDINFVELIQLRLRGEDEDDGGEDDDKQGEECINL